MTDFLIGASPRRFAFRSASHTLIFSISGPKCMVDFNPVSEANLAGFFSLRGIHGTLGLCTVRQDVFLCVVSGVSRPIVIRPGETVRKILAVEFYCLNDSRYDSLDEQVEQHPCSALKKLLSDESFYYSADFDLTRRLQKRITDDAATISRESFDAGFLWNSYMIQPIMDFRSRLSEYEKTALDSSMFITSAIRGYCGEMIIPSPFSPFQKGARYSEPTRLTIISRLSNRRAGTRLNSRGIDDDGNVANFIETETTLWSPTAPDKGECFSYVQVRGSIPVFWEQAASLLPGKPSITITRSAEATQPAFRKHFENLDHSYGSLHTVNLLSSGKLEEVELTSRYEEQLQGLKQVRYTHFDYHAETRSGDIDVAAETLAGIVQESANAFGYMYAQDIPSRQSESEILRPAPVTSQEGVFRTNCLDCLDRTNQIQHMLSHFAYQSFLDDRDFEVTSDFWARHRSLWAENGDALSRTYTGTGAMRSNLTKTGRHTIGGLLADMAIGASRHWQNNFSDKDKQDTIDFLLGRTFHQQPVRLFDDVNDWVQAELKRRASEYTSKATIQILVTTLNLNGKTQGLQEDLSLMFTSSPVQKSPDIIAIAFQEMVELSPQKVLKEDPWRRQQWETAVQNNLDREYTLLRGGQLIGAALLIFVKRSVLGSIKNVEQSVKKTGWSGLAGNKGAVAIRMDFDNTSLCFVTAHLAAGFTNYEDRNRDYRTISQSLRFQRNRAIDDHDSVIWAGDFNYRIGLSNENVLKLLSIGDYATLIENDQLYIQRTSTRVRDVFDQYDEAKITFPPTYKYDIGTDDYDTSEKGRIPAWTDRILMKGNNLCQTGYDSVPKLKFSDHRPVYATFTCSVSAIDDGYRQKLYMELYAKRKAAVEAGTAVDEDDIGSGEDLTPFESTAPPPPSSKTQRWWLDNDMPARTTLEPPGPNHYRNAKRPLNPFLPTDEPMWTEWVWKPSRAEGDTPPKLPPRRPTLPIEDSATARKPPPVPRKPVNLKRDLLDGATDEDLGNWEALKPN